MLFTSVAEGLKSKLQRTIPVLTSYWYLQILSLDSALTLAPFLPQSPYLLKNMV